MLCGWGAKYHNGRLYFPMTLFSHTHFRLSRSRSHGGCVFLFHPGCERNKPVTFCSAVKRASWLWYQAHKKKKDKQAISLSTAQSNIPRGVHGRTPSDNGLREDTILWLRSSWIICGLVTSNMSNGANNNTVPWQTLSKDSLCFLKSNNSKLLGLSHN